MSQPTDLQIIEFVNDAVRKIGPEIWKKFQNEFSKNLDEPIDPQKMPLVTSSFITVLFMWGVNDYCHFTKTPITAGWLDRFLVNTMRVVKDHLLPRPH